MSNKERNLAMFKNIVDVIFSNLGLDQQGEMQMNADMVNHEDEHDFEDDSIDGFCVDCGEHFVNGDIVPCVAKDEIVTIH